MSRAAGRRGLLVVGLVLLLLFIIADLLRSDSRLRSLFGTGPATRQERLDGVRRRGIPVPERPDASLLDDSRSAPRILLA